MAPTAIRVGSANEVTIGGADPGDGNQIHADNFGVFVGSLGVPAKKLRVIGNMIGRSRDNSGPLLAPGDGISMSSAGITAEADIARIEGNFISADGSGVESHSTGAVISGNHIYEANRGIYTRGDTEGSGIGNKIEGNTISDALLAGVFIQNDLNVVIDNFIGGSGTGVAIENFLSLDSTENVIGGDSNDEDNAIVNSAFDAIEIIDVEGSQNEVGRNQGSGNGGQFIDLKAANPSTEPLGPNGGIKPPAIAGATKTEASGSAEAGALVRVFRKASAEAGELASFLGEAVADGSGKWKVSYPSVPGGTRVAATQTSEDGGTSELATASIPPDPDPPVCADTPSMCVKPDSPVNPPAPPLCPAVPGCDPQPTNPPVATITKGPKAKSTSTTASFKFRSSVAGSTFECKLDGKPFKKCKSPKTYKNLTLGKHVFKVRAKNRAGNVGRSVKRKFTVLE